MNEELMIQMVELFDLLDDLECIKELEKAKNNYSSDLIFLIDKYRNNPTIENKKMLFTNIKYTNYLKSETELNYLIMEINNRFKQKRGYSENN